MRLQRLVRVYTCQNTTLLEISCIGSYNNIHVKWAHLYFQDFGNIQGLQVTAPTPQMSGGGGGGQQGGFQSGGGGGQQGGFRGGPRT